MSAGGPQSTEMRTLLPASLSERAPATANFDFLYRGLGDAIFSSQWPLGKRTGADRLHIGFGQFSHRVASADLLLQGTASVPRIGEAGQILKAADSIVLFVAVFMVGLIPNRTRADKRSQNDVVKKSPILPAIIAKADDAITSARQFARQNLSSGACLARPYPPQPSKRRDLVDVLEAFYGAPLFICHEYSVSPQRVHVYGDEDIVAAVS